MARARPTGTTRVSSQHQVTIPRAAALAAGIAPGERLQARADGPGRVVLERIVDPLDRFAGAMRGVFAEVDVDGLRDEWD